MESLIGAAICALAEEEFIDTGARAFHPRRHAEGLIRKIDCAIVCAILVGTVQIDGIRV